MTHHDFNAGRRVDSKGAISVSVEEAHLGQKELGIISTLAASDIGLAVAIEIGDRDGGWRGRESGGDRRYRLRVQRAGRTAEQDLHVEVFVSDCDVEVRIAVDSPTAITRAAPAAVKLVVVTCGLAKMPLPISSRMEMAEVPGDCDVLAAIVVEITHREGAGCAQAISDADRRGEGAVATAGKHSDRVPGRRQKQDVRVAVPIEIRCCDKSVRG